MGFLIGLLTVVMVLDCVVLIFLVLIQLPKKDAGAGLAFGGGATDALFGAGSGNVLTKITKYAAGTFFVLAVVLSLMQRNYHNRNVTGFAEKIQNTTAPSTVPGTPPQTPTIPPTAPSARGTNPAAAAGTNTLSVLSTKAEDTNVPIAIPVSPAPTAPTNK